MKPAPFDYTRPASLAEATAALADATRTAVALGGGQSLVPLLALRVAPADLLVDIRHLPALRATDETPKRVRLGAAITHAMIEDGKVPDPSRGLMPNVATHISYRAVRNQGTIGGSLALADPAADWPAALLALDATVNILGPDGDRAEPIDGFLQGAYQTALRPGEIITSLDIPKLDDKARTGWHKVVRKSGAFALAIACVVRPGNGRPPRAVLGGTTTRAMLLPTLSHHLQQADPPLSPNILRTKIATDLASVVPDADAYQQRLFAATIIRAVGETAA